MSTPPGRLILVSNRLPLQIACDRAGVRVQATVGGLATGLARPHNESCGRWFGWNGIDPEATSPEHAAEIAAQLDARRMTGITLSAEEYQRYYMQVSNGCLWPLFHYATEYVHYEHESWAIYERVNRRFAEAVAAEAHSGDTVFIQDFHLMLVPKMLRAMRPDLVIGFFLHIPFPSSEIFRIFPQRAALLEGVLGADVVAFHTLDYVRHFRTSVRRVLGLETTTSTVLNQGREVRLLAQPLGIDYAAWQTSDDDPDIARERIALEEAVGNRQLLLGVERLDYTKGLIQRLQAFHGLLESDPTWVERIVMIQVAVPSRVESPAYQQLKDEVDRLAGRINSAFGSPGLQPLHYQFRGVGHAQLVALYRRADVAVVTPLRDGLNLVAKEYVAARRDDSGVLVLSEFAGAAWELGEALQVNAFDTHALTEAMRQALGLSAEEQTRRMQPMRRRVREHDVHRWMTGCMDALAQTGHRRPPCTLAGAAAAECTARWQEAKDRIVFLDYDGTLRDFTMLPEDAVPTPEITELLIALAQTQGIEPWVVSGRPADTLTDWLGKTGIGLIAEHGALVRPMGNRDFEPVFENPVDGWRPEVQAIFEQFTDRVPGSRIEIKPLGLSWHYRSADPVIAAWQALELYQHLGEVLAGSGLETISGNRVVEVRPAGVSKARGVQHILRARDKMPDLIFAAGDDVTDESLFRELPATALTVLVGTRPSAARYRVADANAMRALLTDWTRLAEQ